MKLLRAIRIVLAILFLAASIAYFFTAGRIHHDTEFAQTAQLVPSALSYGMGALLFWLCVTMLVGRFYCSTVCPVGSLSDLMMRLRRRIFRRQIEGAGPFRYKPAKRWRYHVLALYLLCLLFGLAVPVSAVVPFVLEPWNIMRNVSGVANPEAFAFTWATLGIGMLAGIIAGFAMLMVVLIWGFISGRDYCNTICPIGVALGAIDKYSLLHVEIDPDKCISCMKCEETCRSSCVKVVGRYVDNTRCVRCLDCITVCPTEAIRLQGNRNRPATPLMRRRRRTYN